MNTPQLTIEDKIATITLCRPDVANRLNQQDLRVLRDHVATVNRLEEVLVLRFLGTGRYFCSGYDITALADQPDAETLTFGEVIDAVEQARPVTIAAVNGGVYGGATDLCLACDFRVGVAHTEMFMPAARLGVHYYQGGLERYVSRLGLNAAKRLFLTTEKIDAATMLEIGFLTELVEARALAPRVDSLSQTLSMMAPIALLGMKKHLNAIARGALNAADLQRDIDRAERSSDLQEGAKAWGEKRRPVFTGN
jgi:enoyl-CoA hydratase/carnithine racemase